MADLEKTRKFLLDCTDSEYVSDFEKVELANDATLSLERSHLTYL